MAKIKIESQEFDLPDETAKDDEQVRAVVQSLVGWGKNATLTRKTINGEMVVELAKKADPKGNAWAILNALIDAPEYEDPAIVVQERILSMESRGEFTIGKRLEMSEEIEWAIAESTHGLRQVKHVQNVLSTASPVASRKLIIGF